MNARLAAYDSALERAEANYWAWSHQDLLLNRLNEVLYAVIPFKPANIEDIGPDVIVGGIKSLDNYECVAYRFVNGGRDGGGRPGRLVILLAVAFIDELLQHDAMSLLRSPVLAEIARAAAVGNVPQPKELDLALTGEVPQVPQSLRSRCHDKTDVDLDDLEQASQVFVLIASRQARHPFSLLIDTRSTGPIGQLSLTTALRFSEEERGITLSRNCSAEQAPPLPPTHRLSITPIEIANRASADGFWTDYRLQRNILLMVATLLLIITILTLQLSGGSLPKPAELARLPQETGAGQTFRPDTQQEVLAYIHYYEVTHAGRGPSVDDVSGYLFRSNTEEARFQLNSLQQDGKVTEGTEMSVTGRITSYRLALSPEEIRRLPQLIR